MAERPRAVLLKFPGTNCDRETARALETTGFATKTVPISAVDTRVLDGVNLVVLSGGFSYGDYVMAGRLAQLETRRRLGGALEKFRDDGGYLLGICNGFQILMHLGLLPSGSLVDNESERFICRWVGLRKTGGDSAFLRLVPDSFELPIAHAEGRLVTKAPEDAGKYLADGHAALCYGRNVNGSYEQIAALQDDTARVFGLMPHPERFLFRGHHYDPDWAGDDQWGWGYYFFKGIHEAIVRNV